MNGLGKFSSSVKSQTGGGGNEDETAAGTPPELDDRLPLSTPPCWCTREIRDVVIDAGIPGRLDDAGIGCAIERRRAVRVRATTCLELTTSSYELDDSS